MDGIYTKTEWFGKLVTSRRWKVEKCIAVQKVLVQSLAKGVLPSKELLERL